MNKKMEKWKTVDRILDALNSDARVDAAEVIVDISPEGRVTLRGTVAGHLVKQAAEEDAKSVPGVTAVYNFLLVPVPALDDFIVPGETKAPADFILQVPMEGDATVMARVNLLLQSQSVLQAERIDVVAENGVVSLGGSVNAFWKRNRTEELALSVEGVHEVINRLTIVPKAKAEDEDLAARIFEGLERNFFINAQTVDVKVNDALVTLRGTVPSKLARWEAFQIALGTEGAVDVRDELIIATV